MYVVFASLILPALAVSTCNNNLFILNGIIHESLKSKKSVVLQYYDYEQMSDSINLREDKFGSLIASVQVDKIGKDCMKAGYHHLYKNVLPIGFLGMVDDIVGITEAGHKASELNAFINIKTAEKTLQFGPSKCKYMIVGKYVSKERK